MFPQCSIYYASNNSINEEHQVFFRSVVIFLTITNVIVRDSHYSPFLLPETPGFWELLWAPTPGPPLKFYPGDLTAPTDPQLARAMTFACRHDIIVNPTNFWWWWFERGEGHMKFSQTERGINNFSAASRGGSKI